MWIWHFGRMIERSQSSLLYLGVVVFIAFFSNATQYLWSLTANFGGLSGVVYGLLGYIWMWQLLLPFGRLRLPPAMIGFLLVALVLMELLAGSWIASAAHTGGLFAGIITGLLSAGIYKLRQR
jgi:GlpG protein